MSEQYVCGYNSDGNFQELWVCKSCGYAEPEECGHDLSCPEADVGTDSPNESVGNHG